MSELDTSEAALWAGILNALTAGSFSHLTMSQAEIKERIFHELSGGNVSCLTTGQATIAQGILTELASDGHTYSALTLGRAGTLAAILSDVEEGGDWWASGSIVHVDLVNARSWAGSEAGAITDHIDTDPNGYTTFEAANLVAATGYRAPDQTPTNSGFSLAGAALTAALAEIENGGAVIVVKGSTSTDGANDRRMMLYLTDDGGGNVELSTEINLGQADGSDNGSYIADFVGFADIFPDAGHGVHNLAYRVTSARVAASVDGQAVAAYDDPDRTVPVTGVHITVRNHYTVTEVIIYPAAAKAESDLDELSAN